MKKNILLICVVALVVISFGYFTLFSSPASDTASRAVEESEKLSIDQNNDTEKLPEPKQGVGTLESLRLLKEDLECKIVSTSANTATKVEGTYFVSNGSMRGDFLTESPDLSGQVLSSIIIDRENVFVWSEIEGETYGMKMSVDQASNIDTNTGIPVSVNEDVSYDCTPWADVDGTVFLPPGDVLFRDLNDLMKTGMEYGTVYEAEIPY
ncbi:hypothetical protein H6785_01550 [Candidatus Nomurabacteria bacterium]|nr:hypothetical protein [Candidatus Kaiserbacteria bacterium]MCB9815251.1 hypothetical protein [Candidatus Nomurabacteria bacterium]